MFTGMNKGGTAGPRMPKREVKRHDRREDRSSADCPMGGHGVAAGSGTHPPYPGQRGCVPGGVRPFFRHEEELESDQHRKAWLIRCTLNCTNTLLSARWRTNLPLEEAVTQCMAPEDRQVYSAVLALPQKYRTAIHLHYYEGYTVDEIAALTGARAGTVKSWLSRGREKLAAELKGDD